MTKPTKSSVGRQRGKQSSSKPRKSNVAKAIGSLTTKKKSSVAKRKALSKRAKVLRARKPTWTIEDGVSYSFLSKFLGCRERTRLAYVEGVTPRKASDPIEFGNIFHILAEEIPYVEEGVPPQRILSKATKRYYNAKLKKLNSNSQDYIDWMEVYESAVWTFAYYVYYWSNNAFWSWTDNRGRRRFATDRDIKFQGKETSFYHEYYLFGGDEFYVPMTGKIDGVFYHPETGKPWIMENKTKGNFKEEVIIGTVEHNLQTMFYAYNYKIKHGEWPAGVLYNIIRRSLLRCKQNETAEEYAQRIADDIAARPEHYFVRIDIELDPAFCDNYVSTVIDPALYQVWRWWDAIKENPLDPLSTKRGKYEHWMTPFGCLGPYKFSDYGDFYEVIVNGDLSRYYIRDVAHPEID